MTEKTFTLLKVIFQINEDWTNGRWKLIFDIKGKNSILKYAKIENRYLKWL